MSIGPNEAGDWSQRYTFSQILAQGGMGIIYLAQDKERQNALCVIKQLIKRPVSDYEHEEAVRLFRREAEVLKFLSHPGVVRLLDTHFTADGHYFLVMDYIEGKSLADLLKNKGTFSSQATIEIAIQCCEVLEYLHNRKPPIIYRDLKPSNLMLTPEGQIVFIDFGIARAIVSGSQAVTRIVSTGYSPPEQYYGKPESRSDLYALGATLGQLLTGEKPKPLSISSPSRLNKKVSPSLDNLVKRLTATSVTDRPSSAQQVRYELYHIYHELDPDFVIPEEAKIIDWQKTEDNLQEPFKEPILNRLLRAFSRKA